MPPPLPGAITNPTYKTATERPFYGTPRERSYTLPSTSRLDNLRARHHPGSSDGRPGNMVVRPPLRKFLPYSSLTAVQKSSQISPSSKNSVVSSSYVETCIYSPKTRGRNPTTEKAPTSNPEQTLHQVESASSLLLGQKSKTNGIERHRALRVGIKAHVRKPRIFTHSPPLVRVPWNHNKQSKSRTRSPCLFVNLDYLVLDSSPQTIVHRPITLLPHTTVTRTAQLLH